MLCSHLIGQFWDTHQPNPNFKRKGYSVSAHMGSMHWDLGTLQQKSH